MTFADVTELYPFLSGSPSPAHAGDDLVDSVRRKVAEIDALRDSCAAVYGSALHTCAQACAVRLSAGGRVLAFGNGGSSTDAQALVRLFRQPPPPARALPALSLSADVAVITALANDVGFDVVYARQLATIARPNDVVVALSTSGNSVNVLRGLHEARRHGLLTVGFAGNEGGQMAADGQLDHLFVVPSQSVHRIQEAQTSLYHVLWELIHQEL